jgi:FkbM family methyltransferase
VEPDETVHRHLAWLFSWIAPDCVLDVGANAGQYGALLREHGYRGWIVSFEPVRHVFDELAVRAKHDGRWRAFHLALGSRSERRRIAIARNPELSSLRRFSEFGANEIREDTDVIDDEEVNVLTLNDSWLECLRGLTQSRVFLKLDTQGWDLEVLKGATRVLDRLVGLQLEAALIPIYEGAPAFSEMIDHATGVGFALTGIYPVWRDTLFRLVEVDCVFINAAHPDAARWPDARWTALTTRFREDVAATVPASAPFVLIDDCALGIENLAGRQAIPFLERDDEYYGAPADGEQAVRELRLKTRQGVRHVAVAWPSFWWLREYPELADHLRANGRRLVETDTTIVFELEDEGGPG